METDTNNLLPDELKRFLAAQTAAGRDEQQAINLAIGLLKKRQVQIIQGRRHPVSALELAIQSGFIGAAGSGLPRDLSTNPMHMEGFGRADH